MNVGYALEKEVVVVTGAGGQIGRCIVQAFLAAGCYVLGVDIDSRKFRQFTDARLHWVGADITKPGEVENAWTEAEKEFGATPGICIAAAGLDLSFIPHHNSICDMPVEQFRKTLDVNTTGTFVTAKTWLTWLRLDKPKFRKPRNQALVIIGSEAGVLGVPGNADYAASKSAIQYGLMLSVAAEAVAISAEARVNAIAPGAVNTPQFQKECETDDTGATKWIEAEATVASKHAVDPEHVARMCLVLASSNLSGSTNGQVVRVDAGKSGRMFWDQAGNPHWKA